MLILFLLLLSLSRSCKMRISLPRYLHVCQLRYLTFHHFDLLSLSLILLFSFLSFSIFLSLPMRSFFSPPAFMSCGLVSSSSSSSLCVSMCFYASSSSGASAIYERARIVMRCHVTSGLSAPRDRAPSFVLSQFPLAQSFVFSASLFLRRHSFIYRYCSSNLSVFLALFLFIYSDLSSFIPFLCCKNCA